MHEEKKSVCVGGALRKDQMPALSLIIIRHKA